MGDKYQKELAQTFVPLAWNRSADLYVPWRDALVEAIASWLWPRYDSTRSTWLGSAADSMAMLNDADFDLMEALRASHGASIKAISGTTVSHRELFEPEDEQGFGDDYAWYDPLVDRRLRLGISRGFVFGYEPAHQGYPDKLGSLTLQLKDIFQRPRPYQVACWEQRKSFTHSIAISATTPSLVSGHCLQGCLAGCCSFLEFRSKAVATLSIEVLKQFAVDIGDRRVFAGVHYPSDNLSSWFVALNLLPFVFDEKDLSQIRDFLWSAIQTKSVVFAAIQEHIRKHPDSPYTDSVNALKRAAN